MQKIKNYHRKKSDTSNLQTKDLASPLVNIQNAPAAPDPQGLQALANLLGKPDLFKKVF